MAEAGKITVAGSGAAGGKAVALGIDVGGTKMAAGVVAPDGKVLSYRRAFTPREAGAEELLAFVLDLARQALAASPEPPAYMGVGCGGPMLYPAGVVSPLHIPVWQAFPLKDRLEAALGLPVELDNDAKAFALGEAYFGAGRGSRNMIGMVVSTGVGGGIVFNGKLWHGATGNAGHIGHVIVAEDGITCECGAIGCLTAYASGTGIADRAKAALKKGESSLLAGLPLAEVTAEAVAKAAAQGDALGLRLITEAAHALARAIASAANLLDLDRAVLGEGVTRSGELLFGPLRQEMKRRACLSFSRNVEVRQAELGREAGVIGAAALAFQAFA